MNVNSRTSCRELFKILNILPLPSQYTYSLMTFVVKNKELFIINATVHKIPTRSQNDKGGKKAEQKGMLCAIGSTALD